MVGILNTFGFKPDLLPERIYYNLALQITQVGGVITLYTVPAGKKLYLDAHYNFPYYALLEPVASSLLVKFGGIPTRATTAVTALATGVLGLIDSDFVILQAGDTITIENTLALGDCTISININGFLV